eukprot:TRINITY_DN14146_c0_g1_i1.p1 TRINITY_DN14146_c0_g1~~TRINITY_DN14146_c0_g1_i1.p1  ORF type:complete len:184 (+),score=39.33 TRINITY_DN14146_c0_g1_i1:54-605(+)
MNGLDDVDNMPDRQVKAGRRALDENGEPRTQKGGWDTGPTKEQQEAQMREMERKFEERYFGEHENDSSMAANGLIPTLDIAPEKGEEIDPEDITKLVAEAPRNYNTHVQGLPDLEQDTQHQIPTGGDNVDLTILNEVITGCGPKDDEDVEWVPQQLFHQLRADLQAEKDAQDKDSEKEPLPKD